MFIGIRLAKAGYYGGDPLAVIAAPVDVVQALLEYDVFESDYEKEYIFLNKPQGT